MKEGPDVNDTLREDGAEGVRDRHDHARKFNGETHADSKYAGSAGRANGRGATLPDWKPPAEAPQTSVANVALVAPAWPQMDVAAFHGLAGDVVHTIEPHSETDPVAILLQTLVFADLYSWGEKAEVLGWTTADLFGLAPVPQRPTAHYRRLSRYDLTGLVCF